MSNAEIVKFLEEKHAAFLQAVAGVEQKTSQLQPSLGEWSIGEVVHHHILIERIVRYLIRGLRWGFLGEKQAEGSHQPAALEKVSRREGRVKTMRRFIPSHGQSLDRLLQWLNDERRKTLRMAHRANLVKPRKRSFRHFLLGQMNGEEWLLFIGHHQERHRRQIEEILQRIIASQKLELVKNE
jgi:hypothetical protein